VNNIKMYLADTGCRMHWVELPCEGQSDGLCVRMILFEWNMWVFCTHGDCPSCSFTQHKAPECWYPRCDCVVRSTYNDCNEL